MFQVHLDALLQVWFSKVSFFEMSRQYNTLWWTEKATKPIRARMSNNVSCAHLFKTRSAQGVDFVLALDSRGHMTTRTSCRHFTTSLQHFLSDLPGGSDLSSKRLAVPQHCNSTIKMLALINRLLDWFRSLFWKEEMELTLVGLQYSGKTTFVNVIAVSNVNC